MTTDKRLSKLVLLETERAKERKHEAGLQKALDTLSKAWHVPKGQITALKAQLMASRGRSRSLAERIEKVNGTT